ncbi:c-type cytochrome domain-containing protein [Allorhodopirellula solitaria]|uniref:Planctomycete cytochrome C n=1 Tax=Allorhodopirellula solitaria TaxID=2527987 RepID=A0A5C5XV79_9BACT|nr:c-type cytochrome domain-containing protein [Allorhodopirellula solitaria]TWT67197.1 Planctomycete cytochrome C [Allorhodopirellula solitaria]
MIVAPHPAPGPLFPAQDERSSASGKAFPAFARSSRQLTVVLVCLFLSVSGGLFTGLTTHQATAADPPTGLDTRSRRAIAAVGNSIKKAGTEYTAKRFDASARALENAMKQVDVAVRAGTPQLYDALLPKIQRITDARVMIELEGVAIAPFLPPPRPGTEPSAQTTTMEPEPEEMAGGEPASTPDPFSRDNNGTSFTSQVAPILASKCGGCHIRGQKGGFSLSSYEVLMKGPREGVVVFPGDTIGSRLIETIETGDMPRGGGKVSEQELATLKRWIMEGAEFDGSNPAMNLTSLSPAGAAAAEMDAPAEPPEMTAPTGNETVDFASQIAPLLVDNCSGCHIDAMQTRGGLQLDSLARMFRGGDSGPVLNPGNGEASLLVKKLRGSEGARMPAGGRPPLDDAEIALISTWIDEGATVPENARNESLKVMTQRAWLAAATPAEVTARREEIASEHFALAGGVSADMNTAQTAHFSIRGNATPETLQLVGEQAEAGLQATSRILPAKSLSSSGAAGEAFFNGRASIYVLPRRYDYSEFAQMVERRSLPADWNAHWFYDGIQAYVAVVASDSDGPEQVAERLAAPVASLAVASRADSVPRWFSDGLGQVVAASETKLDRSELAQRQSELVTAVGTMDSGKEFLTGKLAPERADLIAAAVCQSFLTRERKRGFDAVIRNLGQGMPFDAAFQAGMGVTPTLYFDAWLKWVK